MVVIAWIYNYLCNRCLLSLMLWVRLTLRVRCTKLCDKVCQWLAQFGGYLRVLRFPPIKLTATICICYLEVNWLILKISACRARIWSLVASEYQSKNCGYRIHVLFMMYDVYWYCQMKKKEWLWKFWKRNDLYENFEKRGVVEKRGEEETKSMPHAPVVCKYTIHFFRFI